MDIVEGGSIGGMSKIGLEDPDKMVDKCFRDCGEFSDTICIFWGISGVVCIVI